jgi:hypothetical protein
VRGEKRVLFLSYAEEDGEAAREIAERLSDRGFEVYRWEDMRSGRFIERIEKAINRADAFLVLLSPNHLASPWCHWEQELALVREQNLRANLRPEELPLPSYTC